MYHTYICVCVYVYTCMYFYNDKTIVLQTNFWEYTNISVLLNKNAC